MDDQFRKITTRVGRGTHICIITPQMPYQENGMLFILEYGVQIRLYMHWKIG